MTCDRCGSGRWLNPDNIDEELKELTANGAEIIPISNIKGGIAGMFWRFMVADDNTVAQFIIKILLKFVNHHNFNS